MQFDEITYPGLCLVQRMGHGAKLCGKKHVFYLTFDLGWKDRLVSIETGRNRPVF